MSTIRKQAPGLLGGLSCPPAARHRGCLQGRVETAGCAVPKKSPCTLFPLFFFFSASPGSSLQGAGPITLVVLVGGRGDGIPHLTGFGAGMPVAGRAGRSRREFKACQ